MNQLGQDLEKLCSEAENELVLVAPFIKANVIERLFRVVKESVKITCVTRWRADEIAAGVSDLDVWLLCRNRPATQLWLRTDLHAKYYRSDHQVLIGSANLTGTALGWARQPNLELLVSTTPLPDFEQELFTGAIDVDDTIYAQVKQLVEMLPINTKPSADLFEIEGSLPEDEVLPISPPDEWLPMLRHPENLFTAYCGEWDKLGSGSRIAAMHDLYALEVPSQLSKEQFELIVGIQLLQKPIIRRVGQFLEVPQRFGAVRDFLKTLPCANRQDFDADMAWQTLFRWLICFLPNQYQSSTPNHSEILWRKLIDDKSPLL